MSDVTYPRDPREALSPEFGEWLHQFLYVSDIEVSWAHCEVLDSVLAEINEGEDEAGDPEFIRTWCANVLASAPGVDLLDEPRRRMAAELDRNHGEEAHTLVIDSVDQIVREAHEASYDDEKLLGHLVLSHAIDLADLRSTNDARYEQHVRLHIAGRHHTNFNSDEWWGELLPR